MDPNDFETTVVLNEKEIETIASVFHCYFRHNEIPEGVVSPQSALFAKILHARETQIVEARAAGKLKSPEQPQHVMEPLPFGGKPGEPVPAVDPDDVKSVWKLGKEAEARGVKAIGGAIIEQACKPGADTGAVYYRATSIWMMAHIAPEQLAQFTRDGQPDDAVFRAAAKVPTEWMGAGVVRQGPPFDVNEFLKLCGEGSV